MLETRHSSSTTPSFSSNQPILGWFDVFSDGKFHTEKPFFSKKNSAAQTIGHLEFEEAELVVLLVIFPYVFLLHLFFFQPPNLQLLKHSETEIMLGRCDSVHSGVAMAFVAVGIVGLTVVSTLGLMGYFGVPNGTRDEGNGDFWDFLGYWILLLQSWSKNMFNVVEEDWILWW